MSVELFSEEHKIFRDGLRKFLEKEVVPRTDEFEEAGIYPRDIWNKMGKQGYICPFLDEKYGGSEAGFEYSVIITEELYRTRSYISVPLHNDICAP
ncbi:MAG: acyl-CoA dehydrogenase family protein [Bacillota bacterium]